MANTWAACLANSGIPLRSKLFSTWKPYSEETLLKRILLTLSALVVLALPATAMADTLTFQAPATAPNAGNGGPKQFDLDHHSAYTWRIDNVNLNGASIMGATLTFSNISNWDSNTNMLFVHLLDTALGSGVRSFQDAPANQVPVTSISDFFASNGNQLVASGTGNTFLASRSFSTTPTTFVYTFSAAQLQVLSAYFANGNNIAFGFDPDCHYWNNGITFRLETCPPVPEPTTLALLGTGIAGFLIRRRRQRAAKV
jgi:hypothetical protein